MIAAFIQYITSEKRLSQHTVQAYKTDLAQFSIYLQATLPGTALVDVSHQVLRNWVIALAQKGLVNRTINRKVAALKAFYRFLRQRGYTAQDPTRQLDALRTGKPLPIFFKEKELLSLLDKHPFGDTFTGWRDKLVLELLYGTGIRLAELLSLQDSAINTYEHTIRVVGKRNKERVIPFPKGLLPILTQYQSHRATAIGPIPQGWLLVTCKGAPCYPMLIYRIVKKYLSTHTHADQYSPHILRHTFATHLLHKGADLTAIKALLGHESLAATQVYTHHSLQQLRAVFQQAHPKA